MTVLDYILHGAIFLGSVAALVVANMKLNSAIRESNNARSLLNAVEISTLTLKKAHDGSYKNGFQAGYLVGKCEGIRKERGLPQFVDDTGSYLSQDGVVNIPDLMNEFQASGEKDPVIFLKKKLESGPYHKL
jgi:hypothetical protein